MSDHPPEASNSEPQEPFEDDPKPTRNANGLPDWADWAPSRLKLLLVLGPIIAIPLIVGPIMWIGRPWLATNHPLVLVALSPKVVNLALAVTQVSAIGFYVVAVVRRVMFGPCYFYLGRWGAERGLQWMEENSPASGKIIARLTRWFPRFGPLLVMFYPAPIVRVLAGASTMRFWVFWLYEWIGTVIVVAAVRTLGLQFPAELDDVLAFIKKYTWQLTIASVVYVVIFSAISERRNARKRLDDVKDLEEDLLEGQVREHRGERTNYREP